VNGGANQLNDDRHLVMNERLNPWAMGKLTKNCDQIKNTIPHFVSKYSKYEVVHTNLSCIVI